MFAKLSPQLTKDSKVTLDMAFIEHFMPFAPEEYVKVYLVGLAMAQTGEEGGADIIAKKLALDERTVNEAFNYWNGNGVINILSTTPPSVEYLPVNSSTLALRKFSKTKYKDFNDQLHAMFPSRNILPNEYNEYYSIMEAMHIEPPALLAVIAYSIRQKGESVTYPYILAVARNLAHQGCLTYERVTEQLCEFDLYDKDLIAVLKSLGSKKSATLEDKRMFKKWTKDLGFALETIIKVAKSVKKGGMEKLDALLVKYYENHLSSIEEIASFEANRDRLYELTKSVNRIIGVYYEQLDFIIETYISKWLSFGFDETALLSIAEYCFKRGVRTLEGMNDTVNKFYRQGLLSSSEISAFMSEAVKRDEEIREILDKAGVTRPITSRDRDSYRTWTYTWQFSREVILYAASLSVGNSNPVGYMNALLGSWRNGGVDSVEKAKSFRPEKKETASKNTVVRSYTTEQLNALFDNLDYEDL